MCKIRVKILVKQLCLRFLDYMIFLNKPWYTAQKGTPENDLLELQMIISDMVDEF